MLTQQDMMPLLLAACPSYRARWEAYVADACYLPELVYVHLGDFADHALNLLEAGEVEELRAVFSVVERFFREGDDYVRNAVVVGLLEGIWFKGSNTGRRPQRMAEHLGPAARAAWADAEGWFWDTDDPNDMADLSPAVQAWLEDHWRFSGANENGHPI